MCISSPKHQAVFFQSRWLQGDWIYGVVVSRVKSHKRAWNSYEVMDGPDALHTPTPPPTKEEGFRFSFLPQCKETSENIMAIRKAVPADHRAMAEIAARAFVDDDVFGRFKFPYRREHPEDYISMWERRIWVTSNGYTHEYVVSIDEKSGEIAAWAEWTRVGPGATKRANPMSLRKS